MRENKCLSIPALMAAFDIRAKKSRGQNFLADPATARACVERARIQPDDVVLEIGAGLGALTLPLGNAAKRVAAVEWDSRLTGILRKQLESAGADNVRVIQGDILKIDLHALAREEGAPLTVVGNLPYNISSQVLVKLIEARSCIPRAVLMFQREMAERIQAAPGTKGCGRISVLAQHAAESRLLYSLGPNHFTPKPKVDSVVLEFVFRKPEDDLDEVLFSAVVKAAFGKRRKTLRNALSGSELKQPSHVVEAALERAGIAPSRRAETLSVEEFAALTRAFSSITPLK